MSINIDEYNKEVTELITQYLAKPGIVALDIDWKRAAIEDDIDANGYVVYKPSKVVTLTVKLLDRSGGVK